MEPDREDRGVIELQATVPAPLVAPGERVEVLATTRGLGPFVDVLIAREREVR